MATNGRSSSSGIPMIEITSTSIPTTSSGTDSIWAITPTTPALSGSALARRAIRSTDPRATSTMPDASSARMKRRMSVPYRSPRPNHPPPGSPICHQPPESR